MSSSIPINQFDPTAPTPQNTPLTHAPIAAGLSRPTVPDITEGDEPAEDEEENIPQSAHAAMLGLVQGRLAGLVGRSSGYIESLPEGVKRSIEALKGVQLKNIKLQNEYKRECLELEKKYLELQKPLYERRRAIVSGELKPTSEEINAGIDVSKKEHEDDEDFEPISAEGEGEAIPEFWLTALRNHPGITELITERDAEALKALTDIQISYLPSDGPASNEQAGYRLHFHFKPNEFFTNEVLTKTYLYQAEVGYTGDFIYDKAVGCEINWKVDKDLTKTYEIKKQRNKNTNRTRLVRKAKPAESFFNFFSPPKMPSDEDIETADIDDEELEAVEEQVEMDYQIGEDLKEKIIPRAIDYFTGKALEYEDAFDDDEDDFEDIDDDEDDDDDHFDDDDDSEDEVPARRRGPPKRGAASENVNPDECKQQ